MGPKIFLVQKFWVQKILDPKLCVKRNVGSKKMLGQKKIWVKKNIGKKKLLVKKTFWLKNIFGWTNFWLKIFFWSTSPPLRKFLQKCSIFLLTPSLSLSAKFQTSSTFPSVKIQVRVVLVLVLLLVTGGNQSQLLVLSLSLKFDKKEKGGGCRENFGESTSNLCHIGWLVSKYH